MKELKNELINEIDKAIRDAEQRKCRYIERNGIDEYVRAFDGEISGLFSALHVINKVVKV